MCQTMKCVQHEKIEAALFKAEYVYNNVCKLCPLFGWSNVDPYLKKLEYI